MSPARALRNYVNQLCYFASLTLTLLKVPFHGAVMLSIKSAMLHNGLTTPSYVMAEGTAFRY